MEKLEVLKQNAIKAFKNANAEGKKILSNLFGEDVFSSKIENTKTFEEVCDFMAVNPNDIIPYKNPVNSFQKGINAFAKLTFIADAFNGEWKADWSNTNQKKWYPYFDMSSGFRFCDTDFNSDDTGTDVGSRLCFRDDETAKNVGKTFISLYEELLTK